MFHIVAWLAIISLSIGRGACLDEKMLCGTFQSYNSTSGEFTFETNAWNSDGSGSQCITVTEDGSAFNATWTWRSSPSSVHSYPHITFNALKTPILLSNLSGLNIKAKWEVVPASLKPQLDEITQLAGMHTIANVAIDIFAGGDSALSQSAKTATYEIMIWVGSFGDPKPLGFSSHAACWKQSLGGVNFKLYTGSNHRGLKVFSWIAESNMTDFNEDLSPLIQALWRNSLIPKDVFLGLVQFGTEAFYSEQNVTLSVTDFGMTVTPGIPPTLNITNPRSACSTSVAPANLSGRAQPGMLFLAVFLLAGFVCDRRL